MKSQVHPSQPGAAQTLTAVREYDAFGNLTSSSGAWAGPFEYAGKFGYQSPSIPGTSTPDEGLKLMGHRYYDLSTGQLLISADLVRREKVVSWLACGLTILLVLAITYQSTLRLNEVERRLGILAQAMEEGGAIPSPDRLPLIRPARPNEISGGI